MSKPPYKVLIVDDSLMIRQALIRILEACAELQVVGEACNGLEALAMIPKLKPDLITLDIIMPEMSGLTALKHVMIFFPTPVVMLSSLTQDGANVTFDALRYGAIDFIAKPSKLENTLLPADGLIQKLLVAAKIKATAIQYIRVHSKPKNGELPKKRCKHIVVLGVGEGGYSGLLKIIPRLKPCSSTAYVVVFYEAAKHVGRFVDYLNSYSDVEVKRVLNNMILEPGSCYFSLGEEYTTLHDGGENFSFHVSQAPFSSRRGSIDMLMFSVAEAAGRNSLGVVLTGAGTDGAEGLEEIIRVGGGAIIQAPVNCLYKSMPLAALNTCDAEVVVADMEIAAEINGFFAKSKS